MTRFYVNRGAGRVPEGPFEEQQIVRLISAGKLTSAHYVSAEGSQRFVQLSTHPLFERALTDAGQPLAPRAPAPQVWGPKNTSRGLLLGAVLCIFGLALAAVAIGTYVMFSNGGMPARAAVPTDTEFLFEVPSVPQLLVDLHEVRALNVNQLVGKKLLDDTATDLSRSFGIPKARADALILAASSLGAAGRKLESAPEGGVLLTFSNATPVNTFLSSKRFTYAGLIATNGRKYTLVAATPSATSSSTPAGRTLSALSLDSQTTVLVWFETSKVLFLGSRSFAEAVARVISLDVPSLEQSPGFRDAQRDFKGKPDALGYVDPSKLAGIEDPRVKALITNYLQSAQSITLSFKLVSTGLLTHFVARAHAPTAASGLPTASAQPLSVIDRLPSETFAYVAAATKTQLSGAELKKLLTQQLTLADPQTAARVSAEIDALEQRLSCHFEDILGSIGDQAALAVLAPAEYSLTLTEPQRMLTNFAVMYAQALKDDAPARALVQQLKATWGPLATQFKIQEEPDGYSLTPNDPALGLSADVRFANGYLYVAFGGTSLVERSRRAFSAGENTLATDPAHRAARAALPSQAQLFAWVDAGRIVDTVQKNPLLATRFSQLDLGAVHWTGPDRATAALALSSDVQGGVATYRLDTLNLPVFAGIFGLGLP